MFRPQKPLAFEPINPEYALASSLTSEMIEATSPYILWWSFLRTETSANKDELDNVYGEASSKTGIHNFALKPIRVYLHLEINPIIQELTRLGVEQIESITIYTNIDDFLNLNSSPPKAGDIFRLSYIEKEQKYRNIFYNVSVVVPVDPFNFRHLNYQIYAEQTNLNDVPDHIKNFMNLL